MSDLRKDSSASGQSAAAAGLLRKPESTPSANSALSAAPNQGGGYLSKLFGFGSGTGPSAVDRPHGAMDEAHEYHPGLVMYRSIAASMYAVPLCHPKQTDALLFRAGLFSNRRRHLGNTLWYAKSTCNPLTFQLFMHVVLHKPVTCCIFACRSEKTSSPITCPSCHHTARLERVKAGTTTVAPD